MADVATPQAQPVKKNQKRNKANYAHIHRNALPLETFALPTFHPTNPISLLQLVWAYVRQLVQPPVSRSAEKYIGLLSLDTRSVHITDPKHVRALWEQGFFGKGTLSRSEPSWLEREQARLAARSRGALSAEEVTRARREERKLFKLERARLEREKIENQRLLEQGVPTQTVKDEADNELATVLVEEQIAEVPIESLVQQSDSATIETQTLDDVPQQIEQQEHLQLTLEEAYFLSFGLGVLAVRSEETGQDLSADPSTLFSIMQKTSKWHRGEPAMDDQFILNYVVYHHFRSLGWVVRPGVKFSVDFLLYMRGPVFSHAEFAIIIMPSYAHAYWQTSEGQAARKLDDQKDWSWLHCISRVQAQVKKTLVLCYVDIPPPQAHLLQEEGAAAFLRRYKVREFIMRRWLMNRSRD